MKKTIDITSFVLNNELIDTTIKKYNLVKNKDFTRLYEIEGGYYNLYYLDNNNCPENQIIKNKIEAKTLYKILISYYKFVNLKKIDILITKYWWLIGSTKDNKVFFYLCYNLYTNKYDIIDIDTESAYNLYWNDTHLYTEQELNQLKKDLD